MNILQDIIIFIVAAIALNGVALVVDGDVKLLDELVQEITVVDFVVWDLGDICARVLAGSNGRRIGTSLTAVSEGMPLCTQRLSFMYRAFYQPFAPLPWGYSIKNLACLHISLGIGECRILRTQHNRQRQKALVVPGKHPFQQAELIESNRQSNMQRLLALGALRQHPFQQAEFIESHRQRQLALGVLGHHPWQDPEFIEKNIRRRVARCALSQQEFIDNGGKTGPMFCGECGKKKMTQMKDRKCKTPCHQCFYCRKKRTFYATPEKVQAKKARKVELTELAQERQLKLTSSSDSTKPNKKLCLTKTVETTMKEPTRIREKLGMFHIN